MKIEVCDQHDLGTLILICTLYVHYTYIQNSCFNWFFNSLFVKINKKINNFQYFTMTRTGRIAVLNKMNVCVSCIKRWNIEVWRDCCMYAFVTKHIACIALLGQISYKYWIINKINKNIITLTKWCKLAMDMKRKSFTSQNTSGKFMWMNAMCECTQTLEINLTFFNEKHCEMIEACLSVCLSDVFQYICMFELQVVIFKLF